MTTPNPLTQQRQFIRDFLAANKQRSERERTAQQQYATGEKAAQEQYAGSERAAQQSYAAAIKAQEDTQRGQRAQLSQGVTTIDAARTDAREHLRALGVPPPDLPLALKDTSPQPPTVRNGDPLAAFMAGASQTQRLRVAASQLVDARRRQQVRQRKLLIGAAVAAVVLAVAGYFVYQRWSYDQRIADLQQEGLAILAAVRQQARTNPVDGAVYVPVPAGEFVMGSPDGVGDDDEHPQHTVYLDAFWIMQTEVTNAQYAKCVAAGACEWPTNNSWRRGDDYADYPVTDVDWNQANAYAQWAGGRLPTEAEWEKAARGKDGRTYPWGEEGPSTALVNCCDFVNAITTVGSFPAGISPYGLLDMSGNVWEWTADWYDSGYYNQSPARNPSGPAGGERHVVRGGAYNSGSRFVRSSYRETSGLIIPDYYPDYRDGIGGFRVVASSPGF